MASYLTVTEFKLRSLFPQEAIDDLETVAPGWLDATLNDASDLMNSRLRKRYAVPFLDTPPIIRRWLADLVSVRCFVRLGVNPQDEQFNLVKREAEIAEEQIMEAANSVEGLFDLPLLDDSSALTKPVVMVSSTQSPFVSQHERAVIGRREDDNNRSTLG